MESTEEKCTVGKIAKKRDVSFRLQSLRYAAKGERVSVAVNRWAKMVDGNPGASLLRRGRVRMNVLKHAAKRLAKLVL